MKKKKSRRDEIRRFGWLFLTTRIRKKRASASEKRRNKMKVTNSECVVQASRPRDKDAADTQRERVVYPNYYTFSLTLDVCLLGFSYFFFSFVRIGRKVTFRGSSVCAAALGEYCVTLRVTREWLIYVYALIFKIKGKICLVWKSRNRKFVFLFID